MTIYRVALDNMTLNKKMIVNMTVDKMISQNNYRQITRQNNYIQNDSQGPTLLTMHTKIQSNEASSRIVILRSR